jgi:enterochelin esterase-like enzyme
MTNIVAQKVVPDVVSGKIVRLDNFQSKYVAARNIDIWLPEGYSEKEKSAVIYMQDGQMMFDPDLTWNGLSWDIDDVASALFEKNIIKDFIVVAIWNSGKDRYVDYFPQKPFERLSSLDRDTVIARLHRAGRTASDFSPGSDNYLRFIVEELKPHVDKNFQVYTNRKNTFIAGSSTGASLAWYAACEYPKIFGGAACISTHWSGIFSSDHNPMPDAFLSYLSESLPNPACHRFYFDCGDQTLDSLYAPIQNRVDSTMTAKGYNHKNWLTQYFPGHDHSEKSWNSRLHVPLQFLMLKK